MMNRLMPGAVVLLLCLNGCATTSQQASTHFKRPEGSYKVVVMRPDVVVNLLTAGGGLEQREDWTNTARDHVLASLRAEQAKRGGTAQVEMYAAGANGDDAQILQLNRLHEAVGQSIMLHKYTPNQALPTKKGRFDWTLGQLAVDYGAASGNDYALFLFARDSFSSGGRAALQAVGLLGCIVGVCVIPAGGSQQAFVSLVDLKSGEVVWFNCLVSPVGDIRTPQGARALVAKLIGPMNASDKSKQKKG
jgi:hypothetical protein